jgi:hypothetical protein
MPHDGGRDRQVAWRPGIALPEPSKCHDAEDEAVYRGTAQGRDFGVVAIKQLYATHYFHTALGMSVCVDDGAAVTPHGFYLLTLKGSEQGGTGVKGSILRKVVVDKTRSSLESALASIKRSVERSAPRR